MSTVSIRPFAESDIEAAAAFDAAERAHPWSAGVFRDELAAENRIYLAADRDGLVGFAGVMVVGEDAHVTNLLVEPGSRRQGIGRLLMIDLIEAALDAGARHLTLEVRSRNEAARALYRRFGLAPVGVRRGYYGDDDALILWAHDIDSPDYLARLGGLG